MSAVMQELNKQLSVSAEDAAKRLLGAVLIRDTPEGQKIVRIVETEAYHEHDPASHSFGGKRGRNAVMYGPAGMLYVYFIYGMHYCMNVVTGKEGEGSAVLLRAAEPVDGIDLTSITNGPAKLCRYLDIDTQLNRHNLTEQPLRLILNEPLPDQQIVATSRIGIRQAVEVKARFYIKNNRYVSRP